jgi:surfeit locus 1 family protein
MQYRQAHDGRAQRQDDSGARASAFVGGAPMSRFRPGWMPSLVVLVLFPCLLWLGYWQLTRADEKRALTELFETRREAAPVDVDTLLNEADMAYRRVHIQGRFDPTHSLLLDNRTRNGQVGVELLQPFFDEPSSRWLLVNRGWQPWPDRRSRPVFSTPEGLVSLYAWVQVPLGKPLRLQPERIDAGWPRLVTQVEPERLWAQLQRSGLAYELRLEPGPAALQADWPVVSMAPEKHLGYALQWFALAIALLCLFIYLGIHNARENNNDESGPERE